MYIALSRCTNVNNLYLTKADGDYRFYYRDNIDKNMMDEFRRLENHRLLTVTQQHLRAFATGVDPDAEFPLALVKTRSLNITATLEPHGTATLLRILIRVPHGKMV